MFLVVVFAAILVSASADDSSANSLPVANQASQFMPSAHKVEQPIVYNLQGNQNQESKSQPIPELKTSTDASETHRQGRFFYPFNQFSNSLTGNPSLSSVLTLNLNNLALVGLFLIGVFILLPSIIGFLTGLTGGAGAGPYAAKSLRTDDQPSYMWGVLSMLDNILSKNNIDVRVCMERATCHVSKNSLSQSRAGTLSAMESALNFAVSSSYGQNLLSSYKLKDAVDRGRSGADCDSFYTRCPYSVGNLSKLISTYYGSFAGFNSNPFGQMNATN